MSRVVRRAMRMGRRVFVVVAVAFTAAGATGRAEAAFEAAPWGAAGVRATGPAGAEALREMRRGVGVSFAIRRWEAVPEISWQRAAAWNGRGAWGFGVSIERLSLTGYDEQALRTEVTRGAGARGGWSGALSLGVARWGAAPEWRVAYLAGVRAAWAVTTAVRARVAAESALGRDADAIADRFLVAADAAIGPTWLVGLGIESLGAEPRFHLTAGCRLAVVELGCRVTPAEGLFGLAIGYRRGAVALDLSREAHSGIGAVSGAEVTLARAGAGARS